MLALMLLVAVQAALRLDVSTANDASNAKNRPVTKVVNLIKDMQEQLQKEAEEDQEVYEKLACWCETNDKEKTASIEEAESRITALTSSIEEGTAMSSRLNTEIKNLEKEIARNQESLDKATAMRQKELAEFNAEEKDVLQSIGALKSAIIVLSGHHEFIQVPSETLINIAAMVQWQFHKHADMLKDIVTPHQRKAVSAFIQAPGDYFDAEPTFKQSYAPQSGAIFGILKQMKETFETNLSNSQKEEMTAQAAYQDLKAAKEEEIKSGEEQRDTKTQELADTDEKLAQDKQDLDDTRNSLSADQKFLMNLKETCQNADGEFEERTKSRQEEIKACGEALAILTSDDAHDTFSKTFNFVQVSSTSEEKKTRDSAAKILFEAAKQTHSPRLSALASRVRLDAFTKVKAAIDEMITALLQEKKDEIKHKDFCTDGMNQNERETELKQRDIEELEAKIADLTSTIDELTKAIATLQAEIAEMQTQLKRAGEDREKENADFQTTVADQRASQQILNKALDVLKAVYAKKELMQIRAKQEPAGPPPPPGFKKYEKSGGAGGVLGMIEQIIRDAKQLEAEAIQAETDSQKAYESFVKDSNKSIEEKNRDITTKTEEKASKEADKTAAEEGKETAMNEAQQLSNENADLHKSCDFVLKNFDIRQEARDQEVEALRQAKAILSGAKFFLQRRA
jgi:DNA repair exonuclease SbcCD ATPase subunit